MEEGVGAVDQPGVGSFVVVGCGAGVVLVVHEGHIRGGGRLPVGGGGDVAQDVVSEVVWEATRSIHVLLSHAMVSVGMVLDGGWAMLGLR